MQKGRNVYKKTKSREMELAITKATEKQRPHPTKNDIFRPAP